MAVLLGRKEAIGWNLSNLKGIDPSLCTHRIFLEEDSHLSREEQRRLNPKVWDVVKDEILKGLTAGIIFPISDSPWVSPVHVVPKKAGIIEPKIKPFMTSILIGKLFMFMIRYGFIILILNSFQRSCALGGMVHARSLKCLTTDRS